MFREFIDFNRNICSRINKLFPPEFNMPDKYHFQDQVLSRLKTARQIYDVGGGKHPFVSSSDLSADVRVAGIDVDGSELSAAPEGAYDSIIVGDIAEIAGREDGDLVICNAVLEHVKDVDKALGAIRSLLKPGGEAVINVPCRHALFAKVNRILPEKLKRRILFGINPRKEKGSGFPAYYDRCSPGEFRRLCASHGLTIHDLTPIYWSSYFSFFVPLYLFWRIYQRLSFWIIGEDAAESFIIVARRQA